ncbi:MAG: UDP-N-acetylmuramoyl-tripeptide--D-alanyl-D-alanine ligase [Bacteroidia bacterium]|nr:UDP-N-acetylmuramoyl-tripeptide--D-alanyl-D-alanine ligase [Bacteroidia bacterium]
MTSISELYQLFLQHPVVCTDTRNIIPGSIFFALKGENFNANNFAAEALEKGCLYAVIDETQFAKGEKFLLVDDVLKALQNLAAYHRKQLNTPVIGITGTNGKTTTKELINSVLKEKYKCFATKGNLNNHIGVPLSLLSLTKEHEVAVIEMGASKPGDIEELCNIAFPDYGIITNIGRAHLEGMGGVEGVLKTKTELFRHIKSNGKLLFVNADDDLLIKHAGGFEQFTYGKSPSADVIGKLVSSEGELVVNWKIKTNLLETTVATHLPGSYNFPNIMAAICIGTYFGLSADQIKKGVESYTPTNNRSQIVKSGSNTILMDAYNANPSSVEAALENFGKIKADNKIVILGEMLELGETSPHEHAHILQLVEKMKPTKAFFTGNNYMTLREKFPGHFYFKDVLELLEFLKKNPIQNSQILIKGSRGNKLEKLSEVFTVTV